MEPGIGAPEAPDASPDVPPGSPLAGAPELAAGPDPPEGAAEPAGRPTPATRAKPPTATIATATTRNGISRTRPAINSRYATAHGADVTGALISRADLETERSPGGLTEPGPGAEAGGHAGQGRCGGSQQELGRRERGQRVEGQFATLLASKTDRALHRAARADGSVTSPAPNPRLPLGMAVAVERLGVCRRIGDRRDGHGSPIGLAWRRRERAASTGPPSRLRPDGSIGFALVRCGHERAARAGAAREPKRS